MNKKINAVSYTHLVLENVEDKEVTLDPFE